MYTVDTVTTKSGMHHMVTRLWDSSVPPIRIPYEDAPEILALTINNLPAGDLVKLLEELGAVKRDEVTKILKKSFSGELLVGGYHD